jgi:SPX domain protein involved in polyphosphate accumulation
MSETFERVEKKYLLDQDQYEEILSKLDSYVENDKFYKSDIRSIYYDTERFEMIRRSIEKPEYKEKIRIRSYGEPSPDDKVFVEFKKKLDGIVYKRRTKARYMELLNDISKASFKDEQIGNEIRYALDYYKGVRPVIYIGCERTSYVGKQDRRLRITFDKDICYRMKHLSLHSDPYDKKVTDKIVMELKVEKAMPLWLSRILDESKAYPRGFSKVGSAFMKEIKEKNNHE